MILSLHDLHLILDPSARQLTLWDANHNCLLRCEARNKTTADGQFYHDGNCPPGEYVLGPPSPRGSVPFGPWFIPILDYPGHSTMVHYGRSGIGIHGGGSGLAAPFATRQGWQITHGCWRVQNLELGALVLLVRKARQAGSLVYVTVNAAVPGAEDDGVDDWAPRVALDPEE